MSPISGGLYDRPENRPQAETSNTAKGREWLFWFCMALLLIAAFQVQPGMMFLILLLTLIVGAVVWLIRQILNEIRSR